MFGSSRWLHFRMHGASNVCTAQAANLPQCNALNHEAVLTLGGCTPSDRSLRPLSVVLALLAARMPGEVNKRHSYDVCV